MVSIWVESLGRNFESALVLLEAAIRDCPDQLWGSSMWEVPAPDANWDLRGPEGDLVTDPDSRRALVQRWSTPWAVAWHALEVLDYDLTGDFAPWSPPPLIGGKAHWRDLFTLPSAWSQSDMVSYVDYCRHRVRDALEGMTDEKAAALIPRSHRYRGQPFAWVLTAIPGHTIEHASQIRQFLTGPYSSTSSERWSQ
jgi:hypothetical protein